MLCGLFFESLVKWQMCLKLFFSLKFFFGLVCFIIVFGFGRFRVGPPRLALPFSVFVCLLFYFFFCLFCFVLFVSVLILFCFCFVFVFVLFLLVPFECFGCCF